MIPPKSPLQPAARSLTMADKIVELTEETRPDALAEAGELLAELTSKMRRDLLIEKASQTLVRAIQSCSPDNMEQTFKDARMSRLNSGPVIDAMSERVAEALRAGTVSERTLIKAFEFMATAPTAFASDTVFSLINEGRVAPYAIFIGPAGGENFKRLAAGIVSDDRTVSDRHLEAARGLEEQGIQLAIEQEFARRQDIEGKLLCARAAHVKNPDMIELAAGEMAKCSETQSDGWFSSAINFIGKQLYGVSSCRCLAASSMAGVVDGKITEMLCAGLWSVDKEFAKACAGALTGSHEQIVVDDLVTIVSNTDLDLDLRMAAAHSLKSHKNVSYIYTIEGDVIHGKALDLPLLRALEGTNSTMVMALIGGQMIQRPNDLEFWKSSARCLAAPSFSAATHPLSLGMAKFGREVGLECIEALLSQSTKESHSALASAITYTDDALLRDIAAFGLQGSITPNLAKQIEADLERTPMPHAAGLLLSQWGAIRAINETLEKVSADSRGLVAAKCVMSAFDESALEWLLDHFDGFEDDDRRRITHTVCMFLKVNSQYRE